MITRSLWHEFNTFAHKGSLVDLAVAVIIGAAFGKVVDALVKFVVMPMLSYMVPGDVGGYRAWKLGRVEIGAFLGEVINFLVIALALFLVMVKLLGTIRRLAPHGEPGEPTTKECEFCLSTIPFQARRCAHCTSELPKAGI